MAKVQRLAAQAQLTAALERNAAGVSRLADLTAALEPARRVLTRMDDLRAIRLPAALSSGLGMARGGNAGPAPNNAYDALVLALDAAAPGAGAELTRIETFGRRILQTHGFLTTLGAKLVDAARTARSFEQAPSRGTLEALARIAESLEFGLSGTESDLAGWRAEVDGVVDALDTLDAALRFLGGTPLAAAGGNVVPDVSRVVSDLGAPLRLLQNDLAATIRLLGSSRLWLNEVSAIADQARRMS